MKAKQKISIIIVGASHRDPAPVRLLKRHLYLLNQVHHIPVVHCEEIPCDQSLITVKTLDEKNLALHQAMLQQKPLANLLRHDPQHKKPYFVASQIAQASNAIVPILKTMGLTNLTPAQIRNIAQLVLNYLATKERVELFTMLQNYNLPYQGIERQTITNVAFARRAAAQQSNAFFNSQENTRIGHMTARISQDAIAKLNGKSGVITCSIGFLHTQRLAAHLRQWAQQASCPYDIEVVPMCCYSGYSEDAVPHFLELMSDQRAKDSASIQQCYKTFHTPLVQIDESLDNGSFSSDAFDQVISLAMQHIDAEKAGLSAEQQQAIDTMLISKDIGYKASRSCCPSICTIL